jgi:hypothetical protein
MTCKHGADHKETFCRDAFCGHSNNEELDRLKAENARLREALGFYAQKPEPDITSIFAKSAEEWGVGSATWEPLLDLGEKAREALNSKNNT